METPRKNQGFFKSTADKSHKTTRPERARKTILGAKNHEVM
jgi:hypothetical protein